MQKMMALLLLLAVGFAPGCGVFGTKERVVFVQEATDAAGNAVQMLKTVRPVEVDISFFDGEKWVIVADVTVPAGWLIVSPKVIEAPDGAETTGDGQ